jgi:hypothetical protein
MDVAVSMQSGLFMDQSFAVQLQVFHFEK